MGTPPPGTGLLYAYLLDGHGSARKIDWEGVDAWTPSDGVLWVNLDYTAADAETWLSGRSRIDPLVQSALMDPDPRPRAAPYGDDLLLVVRGINLNQGATPEDMISIRTWVQPRRIVTLRHRASRSLQTIAADLERGIGPVTVGDLVSSLVELVVEHAVTRVDTLGDEIAACEDQVVTGTRGQLRTILADHRRRAIALRRFLAPQREALTKLAAITTTWLEPTHRARIIEVADRMTRTVEELDAARDRAAVTQEELGSRVAEATNQRLYMLSLITAVFLPLGFVCSLLGVNVGGVPLQHADWAFWALCGTFIVGVGIQLWLFRRRGWL